MTRYNVKCPKCKENITFKASKDAHEVTVVCNKCGYMFKVATSSEYITSDVSTIAIEIDPLPIRIVEAILFIILIFGSIFNQALFFISIVTIVISIFFPPLIILPSIISFYVVFTQFGLISVIIYMTIVSILVLIWFYLIRW